MAVTTTSHARRHGRPRDGEDLSAAGRQAAARAVWLEAQRAGEPLTGSQLGARFGRSRSWGNARIHEARHADPAGTPTDHDQVSGDPELASEDTGRDAPTGPAVGQAPAGTGQTTASLAPAGDGESAPGGRPAASAGRRLDTLIVSVVAVVAAAASYEHQRHLAAMAGEGALAWVPPVSVDGMMLATSRSILRRRRAGVGVPTVSWFGFALGLVASVAANVAAAEPTLVGRLLAAWPPLALFIAYETLAADHGEFRP